MKFLYLSASIFPSKAANSVHVVRMCDALTEYSNPVLICRTHSKQIDIQTIYFDYGVKNKFKILPIYVSPGRFQSMKALPRVFRFFTSLSSKDSVIYGRDFLSVFLALKLGFYGGYEFHSLSQNKIVKLLEGFIVRSSNTKCLVCISESLRKDLVQRYPKYASKFLVAHDAAVMPEEEPDNATQGKTFEVGYVGHLYKGRGIEIIIECARLLPKVVFNIYGGLPDDIARCQAISTNNVKYHGYIKPAETPSARLANDVLVMPYQKELSIFGKAENTAKWMSPMKLFEYMSSKRPIISSDLPVLREVLNESNSILVTPDSVSEWVAAIKKLESHRSYGRLLANKAYEDFCANYTWNARSKKIFNMLCNS